MFINAIALVYIPNFPKYSNWPRTNLVHSVTLRYLLQTSPRWAHRKEDRAKILRLPALWEQTWKLYFDLHGFLVGPCPLFLPSLHFPLQSHYASFNSIHLKFFSFCNIIWSPLTAMFYSIFMLLKYFYCNTTREKVKWHWKVYNRVTALFVFQGALNFNGYRPRGRSL